MTHTIEVPLQFLANAKSIKIPKYATSGSAGFDLAAATEVNLHLEPTKHCLIPCGICIALPNGYEGQVRPRSGLALRHGISILNSPGTIDSDYRGEISVLLINHSNQNFLIKPGLRIAQLVIAPIIRAEFSVVKFLPQSSRGEGGFGSTGMES